MRITHDRAMRVMQQVREEAEAKRSIAGRIYPTKVESKDQSTAGARLARAFTVQEAQLVRLVGKRRSENCNTEKGNKCPT